MIVLITKKKKPIKIGHDTYLAFVAMVASLDLVVAVVAVVDERFLALVVQLVEQGKAGEHCAAQRRELVVLVARHCQKCIASVHEIVAD